MVARLPVGRQRRYSAFAMFLHWLMAVLVIGQVAIAWAMEAAPEDSAEQAQLFNCHVTFAILILLFFVIRLSWRLTHQPPALPYTVPRWQGFLARVTHYGLYALLLLMPLTGWVMLSKPAPAELFMLWDKLPIPAMPGAELVRGLVSELGMRMGQFHRLLATILISLVGLHAGAGLLHHFVLRDEVLLRMVPSALHPLLHRLRGSKR